MIWLILMMGDLSIQSKVQKLYWLELTFPKWCSDGEVKLKKNICTKENPYLFVRNHQIVFYSVKVKSDKTYRNRNPIPNYEVRLKVACNSHRNGFNIYKVLFFIPFFVMEKTIFVTFIHISSSYIKVLKRNI